MTLSPKVEFNFQTILNKILGKRVFIFDLETTGLFDKTKFYQYWSNEVFDSARIVEIGYYYSDNFNFENLTDPTIIHNYLRKPTDFTEINPTAQEKHGITIENLMLNGYTFSKILNVDLIHKLNACDYIISHNTMFDFYVLLNELNRFRLKNTIQYLKELQKDKRLLCTCRASGYQSLDKLYKKIFNEDPTVSHRAGEDVKTLIEIIIKKQLNVIYKLNLIDDKEVKEEIL